MKVLVSKDVKWFNGNTAATWWQYCTQSSFEKDAQKALKNVSGHGILVNGRRDRIAWLVGRNLDFLFIYLFYF